MYSNLIGSFIAGTASSLALASPVEWGIHKHLLHAYPRNRRKSAFIEGTARAHNDNHHGAYKGPEHYYRDVTNQHEVIHFSKGNVGLIAGVATGLGAAIDGTYNLASKGNLDLGMADAGFVSGFLMGSMASYGAYEFTHHYMHVIGRRRLAINRVLGDNIQGGIERRDGNLRLSKPLLDDICNETEGQVDYNLRRNGEYFSFPDPLIERLEAQVEANYHPTSGNDRKINFELNPVEMPEILEQTASTILAEEKEYRQGLDKRGQIKHLIDRRVQAVLRNSSIFQFLDNHHFLHHFRYGNNLNVAFPIMDYLAGTKLNSSKTALDENRKLWLCPNSPDVEAFKRKGKPKTL